MKPQHPKKYAAVLRKAAELIDGYKSKFCCCAIDEAHANLKFKRRAVRGVDRVHTDVEIYFHRWLKPDGASMWEGYYGLNHERDNREARILGLLLVALLAEKGVDSP